MHFLPYQNEDGGFGKGIDPDNWNVNSLPYGCLYALETLHMANFHDMAHTVYQGIIKYLEATSIDDWIFTLPSNKDYPHASFYNYSKEYNDTESLGVIITLSAFVLEHMQGSTRYHEVIGQIDSFIERIYNNDLGDMGPSGYIFLVDTMRRMNMEGYNYVELEDRLNLIVNERMQKDEKEWENYGYRPSDFIKSKSSSFLKGNEAVVQKECDFLIRTYPENDVWPVSWCWFDNAKLYPREEAVSLHTTQARKCIERVIFLKEFGRAE